MTNSGKKEIEEKTGKRMERQLMKRAAGAAQGTGSGTGSGTGTGTAQPWVGLDRTRTFQTPEQNSPRGVAAESGPGGTGPPQARVPAGCCPDTAHASQASLQCLTAYLLNIFVLYAKTHPFVLSLESRIENLFYHQRHRVGDETLQRMPVSKYIYHLPRRTHKYTRWSQCLRLSHFQQESGHETPRPGLRQKTFEFQVSIYSRS